MYLDIVIYKKQVERIGHDTILSKFTYLKVLVFIAKEYIHISA